MDYHPEGSKTPRSKRPRLFTVSHVCVWQWMGRRRRFNKPNDLIGSAGKRRAMALKVQPQIAATAINTRLATQACQFMLIGAVRKLTLRMQRKGAKKKKIKKNALIKRLRRLCQLCLSAQL